MTANGFLWPVIVLGGMCVPMAPAGGVGVAVAVDVSGTPGTGSPTLRVTNLVPAFLTFREEARQEEARLRADAARDELEPDSARIAEVRREHWDRHLGEASGLLAREAGGAWAPEELEAAWPRYADQLERIEAVASQGLSPSPEAILRQVAGALSNNRNLEVHLVLYVGTFQDRPAFRLRDGEHAVLLPVEVLPTTLHPLLVDLFARAVHARMANRPADAELSLAEHLFVRGLALRTLEELRPGRAAEEYLGRSRQWLIESERRDAAIVGQMQRRLSTRDPEVVSSLLGESAAGRAAADFDYTAWRLSGMLLMDGWTIDRMASEPFAGIQALVVRTLGG
jgi:hypothetical protein